MPAGTTEQENLGPNCGHIGNATAQPDRPTNLISIYGAFSLVGGMTGNHISLKSTQAEPVSDVDTVVCLRHLRQVYLWLYEWILLQEQEESIQLSDGILQTTALGIWRQYLSSALRMLSVSLPVPNQSK